MAAEKEIWQKIGEGFVQEYYNQFDNTNRTTLGDLYSADACLTWEGSSFPGKAAIAGKLASLPFKSIKHIITEQDFQPTVDSCIFIMVFGQLKVFMLKHHACSWVCTNDVFRLGIHNIPA
uniref:NTF2 domain-containing protein n=1 Tax=Gasterosteus aculeatus aculeatus TaxID=481459 RepID=A0AAQ4RXQ2_GASAC